MIVSPVSALSDTRVHVFYRFFWVWFQVCQNINDLKKNTYMINDSNDGTGDYQMLNQQGRSQTDLCISRWSLSRLFDAHSRHNEYICNL